MFTTHGSTRDIRVITLATHDAPYPRPIAYRSVYFDEWVWLPELRCRFCGQPSQGHYIRGTMLCDLCRFGPSRERGPDWRELKSDYVAPVKPNPIPIEDRAALLRNGHGRG